MKTILKNALGLLLILTLAVSYSCKDDDDSEINKVVGEWKLIQVEQYAENSNGEMQLYTVDYSSQNIIYKFQSNNYVRVSGGGQQDFGYSDGEYPYLFTSANFGGNSEIKMIDIAGIKWIYEYHGSQMILDHSYVDGSKLTFAKQ